MIRTNLFLSESQRDRLAKLAEGDETSLAMHARRAIDLYLQLFDGSLSDVLAEAYRTFPEVENDYEALKKLSLHWLHGRETNSKRGAIDRVGERLDRHERILQKICDKLGIDLNEINGHDAGHA